MTAIALGSTDKICLQPEICNSLHYGGAVIRHVSFIIYDQMQWQEHPSSAVAAHASNSQNETLLWLAAD